MWCKSFTDSSDMSLPLSHTVADWFKINVILPPLLIHSRVFRGQASFRTFSLFIIPTECSFYIVSRLKFGRWLRHEVFCKEACDWWKLESNMACDWLICIMQNVYYWYSGLDIEENNITWIHSMCCCLNLSRISSASTVKARKNCHTSQAICLFIWS